MARWLERLKLWFTAKVTLKVNETLASSLTRPMMIDAEDGVVAGEDLLVVGMPVIFGLCILTGKKKMSFGVGAEFEPVSICMELKTRP